MSFIVATASSLSNIVPVLPAANWPSDATLPCHPEHRSSVASVWASGSLGDNPPSSLTSKVGKWDTRIFGIHVTSNLDLSFDAEGVRKMKLLKLIGLTFSVTLGLCTIAIVSAAAEPLILSLPGELIEGTQFTGSGLTVTFEANSLKTLKCTSSKSNSSLKGVSGKSADSNEAAATLDLAGCKEEKVNCRSENEKGEKDPIETILLRYTVRVAAERSETKELEAILVATLLPEVKGSQRFVCGTLKHEIRGAVPCLIAPDLKELFGGESFSVSCKQAVSLQETGTCLEPAAVCEKLAKEPLELNLTGKFEPAGEEIHETLSADQMIFIDA
jgi:hypothetical protein